MAADTLDEVSRHLRDSRADLQSLLGRDADRSDAGPVDAEEFPRSRVMQSLLKTRMPIAPIGLLVIAGLAFALNPALARRIVKNVPLRLVATRLLTR